MRHGYGSTIFSIGALAVASLVLLLTAMHALTAEAAIPAAPAKTTVTLYHSLNSVSEAGFRTLLDEFEAQYPTITVALEAKSSYDQIFVDAIDAVKNGTTPPNIVLGYPNSFAEYARFDALRFLDDVAGGHLDDFYSGPLDNNRLLEYGGQLAALPLGQSLEVMYYNGDMLASEGVTPPLTWAEFQQVCAGVSDDTVSGAILRTDASHFVALVLANGGAILSDDLKHARFAEPAGREVIQNMRDLLTAGHVRLPSSSFPDQEFARGKAAFTFGSSAGLRFYAESVNREGIVQNWGIAPVPSDGLHSGAILYGPNIAILRSNPEQEHASWLVLKWLTQPDINARFAVLASYFPVRISASSHPSITAELAASPQYAQAYALLADAVYEPPIRSWSETRRAISDALVAIYYDNAAVGPALQDAAAQMDRLLAETGAQAAEITPAGGSLTYTNTQGIRATVEAPAGALSSTQTIAFVPAQDLPATGFGFGLVPSLSFDRPVTISISYRDEDIAGMDEASLAFFLYDWPSRTWMEVEPCGGYVKDPASNRIEAAVCHFSDYVLADLPYRTQIPFVSKGS